MASEENVTPPALPPQVQLYQMAIGHYLSHALNLAATLGVADQLKDGPRPVDAQAAAPPTHRPTRPPLQRQATARPAARPVAQAQRKL